MINSEKKNYDFYLYGQRDDYGQEILSPVKAGQIKMSIFLSNQQTTNNVLYSDAEYIGLTHDAKVNDAYVIDYNGERLKVLYVNKSGRLNQVFMNRI